MLLLLSNESYQKKKKTYCQMNGVNPLLFKTKTHTLTPKEEAMWF